MDELRVREPLLDYPMDWPVSDITKRKKRDLTQWPVPKKESIASRAMVLTMMALALLGGFGLGTKTGEYWAGMKAALEEEQEADNAEPLHPLFTLVPAKPAVPAENAATFAERACALGVCALGVEQAEAAGDVWDLDPPSPKPPEHVKVTPVKKPAVLRAIPVSKPLAPQ